jgi:hypothetical protein
MPIEGNVPGGLEEQPGVAAAIAAHRPGSRVPHTVVFLPSYSVAESLLEHYAPRLLALEHRHLLHLFGLATVPGARMVFVTSAKPSWQVLDYYLSLLAPEQRLDVRSRIRFLEVPDPRPLSVTTKLLDRPDLVAELQALVGGRPAYVDPWNVTERESRLADLLDLPLNGTPHTLWPLGFKSSGRRILRSAGVPVLPGVEGVRTVDDVVAAVEEVRRRRPGATGVVVKSDNSGAGDGNRVLRFSELPTEAAVRAAVGSWERWYHEDLSRGGVVEEYLVAAELAFPSVQVDIAPDKRVTVVSTHEQLLGGPSGQVYVGCRMPADPAFATTLAVHGMAVGRVLAERGALGRLAIDFAAARRDAVWELYALEINLRKTGTTHPFAALTGLVPGAYVPANGRWFTPEGSERCYRSTDNLVGATWPARSAPSAVGALRRTGLTFDRHTGTGVVLHSLCGLDLDGCLGLTAIAASCEDADRLYDEAVEVLAARPRGLAALPATESPLSGDDDYVEQQHAAP